MVISITTVGIRITTAVHAMVMAVALPWQGHGTAMALPWQSHASLNRLTYCGQSNRPGDNYFSNCLPNDYLISVFLQDMVYSPCDLFD